MEDQYNYALSNCCVRNEIEIFLSNNNFINNVIKSEIHSKKYLFGKIKKLFFAISKS